MSEMPRLAWAPCRIATLLFAAAGLVVVAWCFATAGSAIINAHPAYPALLCLTTAGCGFVAWATRLRSRGLLVRLLRIGAVAVLAVSIAASGWLRPFSAVQPELEALDGNGAVRVIQTPTRIEMTPAADARSTGVLFQPGARVDARAYAATLRPLAEKGYPVVIVKQPLGIAFLSSPALDVVRSDHPEIARWVVGGHSLGGTVAALEADDAQHDTAHTVVGLLLFASYPPRDLSASLGIPVLSVSASRDGLATPAAIHSARADLPADTEYVVVRGAVHAQFAAYGPQPGDGTPTIEDGEARRQIAGASAAFVSAVDHR